jgi:hypothetical protein
MDAIQKKLSNAIEDMMSSVVKYKVNPLQKITYENMAKCFNDRDAPDQQVQNCVERESHRVKIAQQIIQNEIGQLSNRIQRCGQDCEDYARDQAEGVGADKAQEVAEGHFATCVSKCADKHIAMLKSIQGRIESEIDEKTRR